jgi:hypothetical protein
MEKSNLMAIGTIVKFALGFAGIVITLVLLIVGLVNKEQQ